MPRKVVREITPAQVAAAASRFSLALDDVQLLADKIILEFDVRGYKHAPSCLLTWCAREAKRRQIDASADVSSRPRDGQRSGALVWFRGDWRSPEAAEYLGWRK